MLTGAQTASRLLTIPGASRRVAPSIDEATMQIKHKTYRFRTHTQWSGERRGIMSAVGRPNISVGSPPEFKGDGTVWAPEELMLGAINTCVLLTFLTLIQGRGVTLTGYDSDVEGVLEHTNGVHQLTQVVIRPRCTVADAAQVPLARQAMEEVEPRCFMSQSVKASVTVVAEFIAGTPASGG